MKIIKRAIALLNTFIDRGEDFYKEGLAPLYDSLNYPNCSRVRRVKERLRLSPKIIPPLLAKERGIKG